MAKERFEFTTGLKKKLYIVAIIGFVLLLVGAIFPGGGHEAEAGDHEGTEQHDAASSGDHETNASEDHNGDNNDAHGGMISDDSGDGHEAGEADHGGGWLKRLGVNLWINNVYFAGLAIIGIFFFTLQYASQAGWSAFLLRVPLAMGSWLPYAFLLMIGTFMIFGHDIFHWTHSDLYNEFLPSGELNPHTLNNYVKKFKDDFDKMSDNSEVINNTMSILDAKEMESEEDMAEIKEGPWMQEPISEGQVKFIESLITQAIDSKLDELAAEAKQYLASGEATKGNASQMIDKLKDALS